MEGKQRCPMCLLPMRADLIPRHMLVHRHDIKKYMPQKTIQWCISHKQPLIIHKNYKQPTKDAGVCLICKAGRTQYSKLGNFTIWQDIHFKNSNCSKNGWESVAKLYTDALDPTEEKEVKEEVKEDVRSVEPVEVVEPVKIAEEQEEHNEDVRSMDSQQTPVSDMSTISYEPPCPPKRVIRKIQHKEQPRNEINTIYSPPRPAQRKEEEEDDVRSTCSGHSDVSNTPLDYWDMEDDCVAELFYALSDILEQAMHYKVARDRYTKLLKQFEDKSHKIGKPYRVLDAFIRDEYTLNDLDTFMTVQ